MNRDEKLNTSDWEVFRAMMASENGLLAIKMGGQGDQTANAIRCRYTKPVPQVPARRDRQILLIACRGGRQSIPDRTGRTGLGCKSHWSMGSAGRQRTG
jgi:hypothetical protein